MFQNLKTIPKATFAVDRNKTKGRPKSLAPLKCTYTAKYIYRILGHVSKDTISYVQEASANITIDNSVLCPTTIQCENYALSKAQAVILRRSIPRNEITSRGTDMFNNTAWDIIIMNPGYNSYIVISYF